MRIKSTIFQHGKLLNCPKTLTLVKFREKLRYVGVLLDHQFTFAHHIEHITTHARQAIGLDISRLKRYTYRNLDLLFCNLNFNLSHKLN